MSDGVFKAGFDHPCKQSCSGWQQGFERGAESRARVGIELSKYKIQLSEAEAVIKEISELHSRDECINAISIAKPYLAKWGSK